MARRSGAPTFDIAGRKIDYVFVSEGLFAEPGIPAEDLAATGLPVTLFRDANLYFGGCQAVVCDPATGVLTGGADPRRGGGVAIA